MPHREDIVIEQYYRKMLWAGAYPLLLAAMAGATWVDRIHAHSLRVAAPNGASIVAMQQVSDRLLLLCALVLAAGLLCAWLLSGVARWLVVGSVAVFCLEFLMPVIAATLPGGKIYFAMLGPGLRMGVVLVALALSVLAARKAIS